MASPDFVQWQQTGHRFEHRGQPVFYQSGGSAGGSGTLLCIHGFPTASWDWHRIWPQLCARFALVLAPDMMGFGYSAKPARYRYSIVDQADLHETLLRLSGVRRFHILAHDYGVSVAQELIARHEERRARNDASLVIESCILLNGGLFPETHRPRPIQKLLASPLGPLLSRLNGEASFKRSFSAVFGAGTQPGEQELGEFWKLIARDHGQRLFHKLIRYMQERREHRERWVGALQKTTVPLRLVNGPDDPVSGAHMVARYRELIPNPDIVSLPHIGHYPQVEDPEGVLKAVLAFHARW
ncbi:MAG: alpha/beta fold hydrolase [Solimonas sp.]